MKGMEKHQPDSPKYADHLLLHISTTAPVTTRFAKARGSITFQPNDMSWSNRGRGRAARTRTKKEMKKNVLMRNQANPGRTGPSQPPKNRTAIMLEINVTPMYYPTKNMPNF